MNDVASNFSRKSSDSYHMEIYTLVAGILNTRAADWKDTYALVEDNDTGVWRRGVAVVEHTFELVARLSDAAAYDIRPVP
jgi:hypothetical protein